MINLSIFSWLHGLAGRADWFDWFVEFTANPFTIISIGVLMLVIFIYLDGRPGWLLASRTTWRRIIVVGMSGFIGWFGSGFLKSLIIKPRPFMADIGVEPLFTYGAFDSFPSGHATILMALAVSVFFVNKKLGLVYVFFAIVIGLSRVVAGVHYPVDIVAGWIIGAVIGFVVGWIGLRNRSVNAK
ncbi:MAG: phosphatase PAP2 family protein [Candidatus Nomurabacteria bacterium]|nr:phosphatase PAP2 family protein [Candidatus Nomurabacteria bacterium]